jgi:hypothetical protein
LVLMPDNQALVESPHALLLSVSPAQLVLDLEVSIR